jgi:hypothetical protein
MELYSNVSEALSVSIIREWSFPDDEGSSILTRLVAREDFIASDISYHCSETNINDNRR